MTERTSKPIIGKIKVEGCRTLLYQIQQLLEDNYVILEVSDYLPNDRGPEYHQYIRIMNSGKV